MAGLGEHIFAANTTPTVSIRRNAALNAAVYPGDFNGDGIIDLAASDPFVNAPGRVIIALGRGDGSFGAPARLNFVGHVLGVDDVNGDGKLDLIVGEDPITDGEVFVLPGNGDGTFTTSRRVNSFDAAMFALSADLNGDGIKDIIVGAAGGSVQIYPGHADGTYPDIVMVTAALLPSGGVVADLNGDGRKDLVVANHDGHSVSIFLNHGAFNFTPSDIPFDRQVNDVTAVDVNGDGRLDLVVATSLDANDDFNYMQGHANVLLGNGNGTFGAPVAYTTAPGAWKIVIGDFTRDGIADIATANRSAIYVEDPCGPLLRTWDSVSIVAGKGDGTFAAASSFSLHNQAVLDDHRFTNSVRSLAVADVNRDGAPDLVASWGAILINQPTDPNWAPTVDLSQSFADTNAVHLRASASDVDQDLLTYTWSSNDGKAIAPVPSTCITDWATPGTHTYTVTVSDNDGNQVSKSVSFTVEGAPPADEPITFTAPAAGEIVAAGQPYTIRWTSTGHGDGETMNVFVTVDDGNQTIIGECAAVSVGAHQCTWDNPGPVTEHAVIFAHTRDAEVPASGSTGVFKIHAGAPGTGALPSQWSHGDIGAVAARGDATFNNGVFTVSASGADIWGTADEFHFVHTQVLTTFELVARVDSVQNVQPWTKAGLMVRTSLDPSAPQASIFVTPAKGIAFQRRTSQGAISINTAGPTFTAPVWLRLTGFNGRIWGYYRKNITDNWTFVASDVLTNYANFPYVGFAVTSHADGTLAKASFSQVRVGRIPDWNGPGPIGTTRASASYDGTVYNISSQSTDIWGTADAFSFLSTSMSGDATFTARVRSVSNTHAWAKGGVMFRETSATGSKHVFLMVTPGKGVNLQYRANTNGTSASAASIAGVAPGWVRLQRAGDTFTASWSVDGVTFVPVGSITVPMNPSIFVGMAHTSHNTSVSGNATFDDVVVQQ